MGSISSCLQTLETERALVLTVVHVAPVDKENTGTISAGYAVGDKVVLAALQTLRGLEPLAWRYKERVRKEWPATYKFQVSRRSWASSAISGGRTQPCLVQIASSPDQRTQENCQIDVADASDVATYAHRFNVQQRQASDDRVPSVTVCVPAVCQVTESDLPAIIPTGTHCTVAACPLMDRDTIVTKFVTDGCDDYQEVPQAFFHYAAFSSGGKEFACDLQGLVDDNSDNVVLLDPVMLRASMPLAEIVSSSVLPIKSQPTKGKFKGPSQHCFNELHPHCGDLCRSFDPQRRTASNRLGMCGIPTCGL